jgi:hypothetical protein
MAKNRIKYRNEHKTGKSNKIEMLEHHHTLVYQAAFTHELLSIMGGSCCTGTFSRTPHIAECIYVDPCSLGFDNDIEF